MKNFITILSVLVIGIIIGCNTELRRNEQKLTSTLDSLYQAEAFFKMNTFYVNNQSYLSEKNQLYYKALLSFVFNKQVESINNIDILLSQYADELNDTVLKRMYQAKRMSHINTYEYQKAVDASNVLINDFEAIIDTVDYANFKNEHKIWIALSGMPRQEVIRKSDCIIPMYRDKVGLMNVNTLVGNDSVNFLFDTGANFSVIIRSLAKELGMDIIEADFYVTAATGKKVPCDLAIMAELQIGEIIVKNSVFLVMDDENLSFPQIDYFPNGAIGFPIIEAFDELRFLKSGDIFIPKNPIDYQINNLALNGLMPVLACEYNGDTLSFNFDTGASSTTLYNSFFEKYKEQIESSYQPTSFSSASGGGEKSFEGYELDSVSLEIGNSKANISNIRLHIYPLTSSKEYVYGNLGQDYIKQFDEMIISFKHSSVLFK